MSVFALKPRKNVMAFRPYRTVRRLVAVTAGTRHITLQETNPLLALSRGLQGM